MNGVDSEWDLNVYTDVKSALFYPDDISSDKVNFTE